MAKQLWNDKDPSLLKGYRRQAKANEILQPFVRNGYLPIYEWNILERKVKQYTTN